VRSSYNNSGATGGRTEYVAFLNKWQDKKLFAFCSLLFALCPLLFALSLVLGGCGYTTRGFSYKENKIFVMPVVNKIRVAFEGRKYSGYRTFPVLLEKKLTNELVSKFNIDGHLKVVNQKDNSLSLSCVIKDYQKEPLRYTDSDNVEEHRLRLFVRMILKDSTDNILIDKDVVGETTFFLSGPNRESEESAQVELINDTARRILEAVIERW
jgi:outer membrane lipopolysaccharide assembly protein LptE/RlpB